MKTKSLLFAALVLMSSVAVAGMDEPRKTGLAVVPVKGTQVFKVIYKGETAGRVKLNIYNSKNELILNEIINGVDGFICPVNFKGLAEGEYTIEIVDASGKKVEKVSIAPTRSIKHIHVSKLLNEDAKYLLSIANAGANKINVKIFDAQQNLIHTESKVIDGDFAQVYKLAKSSSYTFQVTDNDGNTKSITF